MICPRCGAEYPDRAGSCFVCDLPLAEARDWKPLVRITDIGSLAVIKSLLAAAEIPYFVQGETAFSMLPMPGGVPPFSKRAMATVLHVPSENLEEAKALLEAPTEVSPELDEEDELG